MREERTREIHNLPKVGSPDMNDSTLLNPHSQNPSNIMSLVKFSEEDSIQRKIKNKPVEMVLSG